MHVSGNQQSLDIFPGSESDNEVKAGIWNYQVTEYVPEKHSFEDGDMSIHFSQDCPGIMHNNEEVIFIMYF